MQGRLFRHQAVLDLPGDVQLHFRFQFFPVQPFDASHIGADVHRHLIIYGSNLPDLILVFNPEGFRFPAAVAGKAAHAFRNHGDRLDDPPPDQDQQADKSRQQDQRDWDDIPEKTFQDFPVLQHHVAFHRDHVFKIVAPVSERVEPEGLLAVPERT